MTPLTRGQLFILAGGLAVAAVLCLVGAATLAPDIRSHVKDTYSAYGADEYACDGTPKKVADDLSAFQPPEARASDKGSEFLRYDDDIVIVGPDGNRPCAIQVQDLDDGYSHGSFIFLGPGFTPGSPAGGSGGSSGGPGDGK